MEPAEVMRLIPQERVQQRIVEQIVNVLDSASMFEEFVEVSRLVPREFQVDSAGIRPFVFERPACALFAASLAAQR